MAGSDILAVGQAFREAADELLVVADQLADQDAQRADSTPVVIAVTVGASAGR